MGTNVNDQNINIQTDKLQDNTMEDSELNVTLKEVSNLLEKCWKNEGRKRHCDQQTEIGTLREILSVYQNLSKLVQLQSDTLKSTITDLCNADIDFTGDHALDCSEYSSPDRRKSVAHIQLLSSADRIPKSSSGKRKRRKNKKSKGKTTAFSFEYNRATVSSKNKKAKTGSNEN